LNYEIRVEDHTGAAYLSQGTSGEAHIDLETADDQGIRLDGATRVALMQRLSSRSSNPGTLPLSQVAAPAVLNSPTPVASVTPKSLKPTVFMILKNMFDSSEADEDPELFTDVKEAVTEECAKFGTVEEISCDENSPDGLVYLRLDSIKTAEQTRSLLDGRWYAGKVVAADYLTEEVYNSKRRALM